MRLRAFANKILVLENRARAHTISGITIPVAWRKKTDSGWVVSVGKDVKKHIPELTDKMFVIFRAYAGQEIEWQGNKFRLLEAHEMVGMVPKPSVDAVAVES